MCRSFIRLSKGVFNTLLTLLQYIDCIIVLITDEKLDFSYHLYVEQGHKVGGVAVTVTK